MESIHKYFPSHPLLQQAVQSIVFWRRSADHTEIQSFLPNNICGFGLTLSGHFYVKKNDAFEKMPVFGTRNLLDQASEVKTSGDFLNIAVRLTIPNGLCLFTKIPMNEVYQLSAFSLDAIFKDREIAELREKLMEADNDSRKLNILELFLISKIIRGFPPILANIVSHIQQSGGLINVTTLVREFAISERSINRYFNTYIGINPIAYINLIRFRAIINLSPSSHEGLLSNALNAGYYDQSHFIKHFKQFCKLTPGEFFLMNKNTLLSDFYNT